MAKKKIETSDYRHEGEKRKNVPPAAMVAEGKVPKVEKVKYAYSPHLDPVLRFDPTGGADRCEELLAGTGKMTQTPKTVPS